MPPAPQVVKNLLAAARFENFFSNVTQSYFQNLAGMQICEQNLILHISTKFHDDDVIHTKIMAIFSTSTCGIFNIS